MEYNQAKKKLVCDILVILLLSSNSLNRFGRILPSPFISKKLVLFTLDIAACYTVVFIYVRNVVSFSKQFSDNAYELCYNFV